MKNNSIRGLFHYLSCAKGMEDYYYFTGSGLGTLSKGDSYIVDHKIVNIFTMGIFLFNCPSKKGELLVYIEKVIT
jgi:hypothetical protein